MNSTAAPGIHWKACVRALRSVAALAVISLLAVRAAADAATSGTVITIAGTGTVGFSGDGGSATNAALNYIEGLAFGPDGTLYIADSGNFRIRAINPATGIIRTIAGTGVDGNEGNNGPATNATITSVIGLATDRARNRLYLTDWANNWVRKVDLNTGILTLYAGSGDFGFDGDGGPAISAKLLVPIGAATDGAGRLSFIDVHNDRIRQVNPVSGIITTIAGSGIGGAYLGDGGPATSAALGNAIRVAADPAGNVFLRDGDPNGTFFTVRRVDATSGIINTIVGGGTNAPGTGMATNMFFNNLAEVAANDAGELFVATPYRVFKLNIATGIIAPFAGDGTSGLGNEGDPALSAKFANITALAVAPGGGLVIADTDNARIRYVAPDSINLTNDSGQTSFALPWVNALTGDFILANNLNLTNVNAVSLTNVGGVVSIGGNTAAGEVNLDSLQSAGTVVISGNTAAGVISLGELGIVAGEITITENPSAGVVDLSSLESSGTVEISGNTAAGVISLGELGTVAGEVTITDNTNASVIDLSSLTEASGDVTIESNAMDVVVNLGNFTTYGCGTNDVTMTLNGGTVEMTNGLTLCTNATLTGSTTIDGSVTNSGTIEPGSSPGHLNMTGNLHLNSSSRLHLEIGGYASNEFDVVNVGGSATLGGTISLSLHGNFKWVMTNGSSFTLMTAGSALTGSFANAASGAVLTTTDGYARFTLLTSGNSVRLTELHIVDSDADGMPDWWEDHVGLSKTNAADAELDLDGDRASNANEFAAGTDPANAASVFRLISIQTESNGVRLTWNAVGGKTYRIQTNGTLPGEFTDDVTVVTAFGVGEFITNVLSPHVIASVPARYYRLRLGP